MSNLGTDAEFIRRATEYLKNECEVMKINHTDLAWDGCIHLTEYETPWEMNKFRLSMEQVADLQGLRHGPHKKFTCIVAGTGTGDNELNYLIGTQPDLIYDPCVQVRFWQAMQTKDRDFFLMLSKTFHELARQMPTASRIGPLRSFLYELNRLVIVNLEKDTFANLDSDDTIMRPLSEVERKENFDEAYQIVMNLIDQAPSIRESFATKYLSDRNKFFKRCRQWFDEPASQSDTLPTLTP